MNFTKDMGKVENGGHWVMDVVMNNRRNREISKIMLIIRSLIVTIANEETLLFVGAYSIRPIQLFIFYFLS